MKFRRIVCLVLLVLVLNGCGNEITSTSDSPSPEMSADPVDTASTEPNSFFPKNRFGNKLIDTAERYSLEDVSLSADVVAHIRISNWIIEDIDAECTHYIVEPVEVFKGELPDSFTLYQDGCSDGAVDGYPLFINGNELFVFLSRVADDSQYDNAYSVLGSHSTIFYVGYDNSNIAYALPHSTNSLLVGEGFSNRASYSTDGGGVVYKEVLGNLAENDPEVWQNSNAGEMYLLSSLGERVVADTLGRLPTGEYCDAPPWDTTVGSSSLNYDEYFAQHIYYGSSNRKGMSIATDGERTSYYVEHKDESILAYDTKYAHGEFFDQLVWTVPGNWSDCEVCFVTNSHVYGVKNGNELFRVDWFGENYEILFFDESSKIGVYDEEGYIHGVYMADECIFFTATRDENFASAYRIYLPTNSLDLIYDEIPYGVQIYPEGNHEITWETSNGEFWAMYDELLADPQSILYHEGTGEENRIPLAAEFCNQPIGYYHYYNSFFGEYKVYEDWGFGQGTYVSPWNNDAE